MMDLLDHKGCKETKGQVVLLDLMVPEDQEETQSVWIAPCHADFGYTQHLYYKPM